MKTDRSSTATSMRSKLSWIAALLPFNCLGRPYAENPQVNNAWRCNSMTDPKKKHTCRKSRAANLWCRDFSRCEYGSPSMQTKMHIHPDSGRLFEALHCSDSDVARRVGMTCSEFPFYNGGYPVLAKGIEWDEEWEQYDCKETNLDQSVCMSWSTHEMSTFEYEVGFSNCTSIAETASGYKYCQTWKTQQRETQKCGSKAHGCSPNCLEPTYCFKRCCRDSHCYDCSYTPHMELEYSEAECTKVNEKGACLEWSQEEYDQHNLDFREYGKYYCVELSENEEYCQRWVGEIDSEEEFEISTCECTDPTIHFCARWTCYETGYDYYFPNLVWVLLPISICGTFVACCFLCIRDDKIEGSSMVCSLYMIFGVGFTFLAATLAGVAAILIAAGTIFVLFPLSLYVYWSSRQIQRYKLEWNKDDVSKGTVTRAPSSVSSATSNIWFAKDHTVSTHEDKPMDDDTIIGVEAEPIAMCNSHSSTNGNDGQSEQS